MELVRPSVMYKDSYIQAAEELREGSDGLIDQDKMYSDDLKKNFPMFIEKQLGQAAGIYLPSGYVPVTHFWLVDEGVYIGRVSIRHHLNDHLLMIGGHIGYSIRPSKRGLGYGSQILAPALPEAKKLGIKKALLTCDASKIASRKIIEKNGGILESEVSNAETGVAKLRFWIERT